MPKSNLPTFEDSVEYLQKLAGIGVSPELDDYVDQLRADRESAVASAPVAPEPQSSTPPPGQSESETAEDPYSGVRKKKNCIATNADLDPCVGYAMQGTDFCYFHDEATREARLQASSRGGKAERFRPAIDVEQLTAHLKDQLSIQAVLEGIFRMQLAGAIPTKQVSQILRTLRMVERNVPAGWMLKNGGDERYDGILQNFLETAGVVEESLDERDVHERESEILDTGAKRSEYLKANRKHNPAPGEPRRQRSGALSAHNYRPTPATRLP